ncbi:hypothetical protein FB451DRAFT_1172275 [Mycena latifolia]|nr:hypothetical protein FB451DRAFT_1172275 [Mycena latifolia]
MDPYPSPKVAGGTDKFGVIEKRACSKNENDLMPSNDDNLIVRRLCTVQSHPDLRHGGALQPHLLTRVGMMFFETGMIYPLSVVTSLGVYLSGSNLDLSASSDFLLPRNLAADVQPPYPRGGNPSTSEGGLDGYTELAQGGEVKPEGRRLSDHANLLDPRRPAIERGFDPFYNLIL